MTDQLQSFTGQIRNMVLVAGTADPTSISSPDLRRVLGFVTEVVQVVDQAFEKVYTTLLEFKYLTVEDIRSGRLIDLSKKLELLRAHDHYRKTEQICSRLHELSRQYDRSIKPVVEGLGNSTQWFMFFELLEEHEGRIIDMVDEAIRELEQTFDSVNEVSLSSIRRTATEKADSIRKSLGDLRSVKDQILGLSGDPGFLELTEIDRFSLDRQVKVIMGDNVEGNKPTYNIGDISNSTVSGVVLGEYNTVVSSLNASGQVELAQALKTLTDAVLASKNLPDNKKQEQVQVISQIGKEASGSQPNKTMLKILVDGLMTTLKAVPDIAGAVIAVAPVLTSLHL